MIAITGATGQLGQLTIKHLLTKTDAQNIVGLARNPESASQATPSVTWKASDYNNVEVMTASLAGVTTLFMISGSEVGQRKAQHQNIIDAAKSAGVKHIVYTSILKADTSPLLLAAEHKLTEAMLAESGLETVIMRNGWYTENYTMGAGHAVDAGAVCGAAGDGRFDTASRDDFAEVAANILTNIRQHVGNTYELVGSTSFTLTELAAAISTASGKAIGYENMSQQAYQDFLTNVVKLPEGLSIALADSEAHAQSGWLSSESNDLETLLGRKTKTILQAVQQSL